MPIYVGGRWKHNATLKDKQSLHSTHLSPFLRLQPRLDVYRLLLSSRLAEGSGIRSESLAAKEWVAGRPYNIIFGIVDVLRTLLAEGKFVNPLSGGRFGGARGVGIAGVPEWLALGIQDRRPLKTAASAS